MQVKFPIPELERIVHPDNLLEVLDCLFDEGKIVGYHYDWENGDVYIDVSEKAIVEDIFKEQKKLHS